MFFSQSLSSFQTTPHHGTGPNPKAFVRSLAFPLFLSVYPIFSLSQWLFLVSLSPFLSYNLQLFSLSLVSFFLFFLLSSSHTHSPFLLPDFTGCLCFWLQSDIRCPSQYSTQALGCNKQTIATDRRSYKTLTLGLSFQTLCLYSNSQVSTSPLKAPRAHRDLVVSETTLAIKKHMRKPYGVPKVSMLRSPIDTQHYSYPCCLPMPVARPLNIECDVAYWYCH